MANSASEEVGVLPVVCLLDAQAQMPVKLGLVADCPPVNQLLPTDKVISLVPLHTCVEVDAATCSGMDIPSSVLCYFGQ